MVNSERNLTLLQQSIPPAGQARPDWQLICQVAAHMGFGEHFGYQSSEEIFDEIRRFCQPGDRLRPARRQLRAAAADAAAVALPSG
jgi:anaerobic selenocysteine-containing dehydrogenase